MKFTLRFLLFAVVAAAVVGAFAFPSNASANHSWNGYHWARTANPFTVNLGDNTSGEWKLDLPNVSSDWSKSNVLDTSVIAGQANPKNCRPTSGRVEVCNSS